MPEVGRQMIPLELDWTVCRDLVPVYTAEPTGNTTLLKNSSPHVDFGFGLGRIFAGDYSNRLGIASKSAGD